MNFQNGDPVKWVIASGPIVASGESAQFYAPIISDPVSAGTIFQGSLSVWRTQDWAGNQAFLEANCPEFTTSGANPACGDFVAIGPDWRDEADRGAADYRGTTRCWWKCSGGRTRQFRYSDLMGGDDDRDESLSRRMPTQRTPVVTYTRLDSLAANSPGQVRQHASSSIRQIRTTLGFRIRVTVHWTPATPGHVFSVRFDPGPGHSATWTNLDGSGADSVPGLSRDERRV